MSSTLIYSIVTLTFLNLSVLSLIFVDPKEDVKRARRVWGGSAIPLKKGEKMVVYDPKYNRATSVVILVSSSYERVRRELRHLVGEKIGIAAEAEVGERDEGIFPDPEPRPKGLHRQVLFGKGFVKFREIGIHMKHPKEYQLKSGRYNEIEELSGSSELRLRMADGKVLFGKDCALIVVSRIDRTKQYTRYYDIPLPPRESVEEDVVTDTEIGLIENSIARLGKVKMNYFVPYPGYKGEEYWMELMRAIRDAAKNL